LPPLHRPISPSFHLPRPVFLCPLSYPSFPLTLPPPSSPSSPPLSSLLPTSSLLSPSPSLSATLRGRSQQNTCCRHNCRGC
jgi:hypothetical protein